MRTARLARRALPTRRIPLSTYLRAARSRAASTLAAEKPESVDPPAPPTVDTELAGRYSEGRKHPARTRRQWSSYDADYEEHAADSEDPPTREHRAPHVARMAARSGSASASLSSEHGGGPSSSGPVYWHGKQLAPKANARTAKDRASRPELVLGTQAEPFKTLDIPQEALVQLAAEYRLADILSALYPLALHREVVWPGEYLVKALAFIPSPEAIIKLLHIAQKSIPHVEARGSAKLSELLLRRMGQAHVLSPLPGVIDLLLATVTRAVDEGVAANDIMPLQDLLYYFVKILWGLQHFRQTPRHGAPKDVFHPLVRTQVVKVTQFFIDLALRYPSTSQETPIGVILNSQSLAKLILPGFMSAELSLLLRTHLSTEELSLKVARHLLRQALVDGDQALAEDLQARVRQLSASGFVLSSEEQQELADSEHTEEARLEPRLDRIDEVVDPAEDEQSGDVVSTVLSEPTTRQVDKMDQMVFDVKTLSIQEFYEFYKRTLYEPSGSADGQLGRHVWHRLAVDLLRQARAGKIKSAAIDHFFDLIPHDAVSSQTVSPLISAHVRLGEPQKALRLWDELYARERVATRYTQGSFITPRVMAALTPAFCALYPLREFVQFFDTWARGHGVLDEEAGRKARWFSPDKTNLNVLLIACHKAGDLQMALRVFALARSRWRIVPDDNALAILVYATQHKWQLQRRKGGSSSDVKGSGRMTIRKLFFGQEDPTIGSHALACYDRYTWSPGASRWAGNPLFLPLQDNEQNTVNSWMTIRRLFREVILGNWPALEHVRSPIDTTSSGLTSIFFGPSTVERMADPITTLPGTEARYTSMFPSPAVFGRYLAFLGYFGLAREIPLVFAWMKALDVKPEWPDMRKALMYMSEYEGPRRFVYGLEGGTHLMRDEQVMRAWLEEWLGTGLHTWRKFDRRLGQEVEVTTERVPTEQDVEALRKNFESRKIPLTVLD